MTDQWGRSIEKMEAELAAAWVALEEAADDTGNAYDQWMSAATDAQERKGQIAWDKAHEKQNRAAQRLHAANTALGRPARDDRRTVEDGPFGDPAIGGENGKPEYV